MPSDTHSHSHSHTEDAPVLASLAAEHRRLAVMLELIETEIGAFEAGGRPDYDLVQDILRYLLTYPDLVHHPKEDAVLRRLKEVAPDAAEPVGDLEAEHARLGTMLRRFHAAMHNVLVDQTLPRDWFAGLARDFVEFQRRHMQMEEVVFFPAARAHLGPDDWIAIEAEEPPAPDPLARCVDFSDTATLKACLEEQLAGV